MIKRSASRSSLRAVTTTDLRAVQGGFLGSLIKKVKDAVKGAQEQPYLEVELEDVQVSSY